MTIEKFEEAEKIMEEIREIKKFISVYKDTYNASIKAVKDPETSLGHSKEFILQIRKNSFLYESILDLLYKREKALMNKLEKI